MDTETYVLCLCCVIVHISWTDVQFKAANVSRHSCTHLKASTAACWQYMPSPASLPFGHDEVVVERRFAP